MKTENELVNEPSLYFWLGADGEVEEVSEAEFTKLQEDVRADLDRWAEVELGDGGTIV
jgi:hypothetical protein